MTICYIGIGSNLGNRQEYIAKAIEELKRSKGIKFKRASSIYETDPVSEIPQGKFLNGVLEIETDLAPHVLMRELNRIEDLLGRRRGVRNAPRTIDLDILYYGEEKIRDGELAIPHPLIREREFVLRGLRELHKA
jgi:2-amino-4-hydroxy-6-hydroxymethyldihydropteridine diphosphokinase